MPKQTTPKHPQQQAQRKATKVTAESKVGRGKQASPAEQRSEPEVAHRLSQRLSVREVANAFGRKPRTVRSWIEKGQLAREKVGNSVFIRMDQIEDMLRRSTAPKKDAKLEAGKRQ